MAVLLPVERRGLDGRVEGSVTPQERGSAVRDPAGLGPERGRELLLETRPRVRLDDRVAQARGQLPGPEAHDVEAGAGRQEVGDRAVLQAHARAVVQRWRSAGCRWRRWTGRPARRRLAPRGHWPA